MINNPGFHRDETKLMTARGDRTGKAKGFTLIEMILVILTAGIVALMISPLLNQGFSAYFTANTMADMEFQARLPMERMAREVRQIQVPNSEVFVMEPTQFRFLLNGKVITYRMSTTSPGTLVRIENNDEDFLATNITAFAFHYLEKDLETETIDRSRLWAVKISFSLDYQGQTRTFNSLVFLRNAA